MSINKAGEFTPKSTDKGSDKPYGYIVNASMDRYKAAFEETKSRFADLENSRKQATLIKKRVMDNLDKYLVEFEANFTARGGKVIWANDASEARDAIWSIIERKRAKSAIRSQSMTMEEIGLQPFLKSKGIELLDTEFSTYARRLLEQRADYSATRYPDQEETARLFNEKFGTPHDTTAEQLALKAREILRPDFEIAEIGLTGVNFLIAETGSIAILENEGNIRLATTFPRTHIAIAGIEKIIPSTQDLHLFWPLSALYKTGQPLGTYNSLLTGPRQPYESDGPEEMYVILLDNGRTNLLEHAEQRQALYSPYYGDFPASYSPAVANKTTAYTPYPGPIGSVVTPYLNHAKTLGPLSYAWPLSGNYKEVYPVDIDINRLLLLSRRDSVKQGLASTAEQRGWKWFTYLMQRRRLLDLLGGKVKNFLLRRLFKKSWGKDRELPTFARKSFAQQWKAQQKQKD